MVLLQKVMQTAAGIDPAAYLQPAQAVYLLLILMGCDQQRWTAAESVLELWYCLQQELKAQVPSSQQQQQEFQAQPACLQLDSYHG